MDPAPFLLASTSVLEKDEKTSGAAASQQSVVNQTVSESDLLQIQTASRPKKRLFCTLAYSGPHILQSLNGKRSKTDSAGSEAQCPSNSVAVSSVDREQQELPSSSSNVQILTSLPFLTATGTDDKPRPFYNLGNSCFINAALTALFGSATFRRIISQLFHDDEARLRTHLWSTAISISGNHREKPHERNFTNENRLAVTYAATLRAPTPTDNVVRGKAIVPYLFTHHYYHGNQEDTNEFLQNVLNIDEAPHLFRACEGLDSPLLRCRLCASERATTPEWFNWLNLPLLRGDQVHQSMQQAVDAYFEPELLKDRDTSFRCANPACRTAQLPYKVSQLTIAPQVLCIQLKRWQTHRVEDAILHNVHCDEDLVCQGFRYELHSVICHMGTTPKTGHYTCRIRYPASNGTWWYYNNSTRRTATAGEIHTTSKIMGNVERSYLAFYEKVVER